MRVYVLTDHVDIEGEDHTVVIGTVSSKKAAIDACESFLGRTGQQGIINWVRKDKHFGYAEKDGHEVTYKMYFVNQLDFEE